MIPSSENEPFATSYIINCGYALKGRVSHTHSMGKSTSEATLTSRTAFATRILTSWYIDLAPSEQRGTLSLSK